jgi:hypothetical protein
MPIDTLNKRAWDGTGAGIGHGSPIQPLVTKINEIIAAVVSMEGAVIDVGAPTELTLTAPGVLALTGAFHSVDTFADAASDTVTSITGMVQGRIVALTPANTNRTVIFQHASGNILCLHGQNVTMAEANDVVLAFSPDGTNVVIFPIGIQAADGGGAGAIIGLLSALNTTDKASVVAAVNELKALLNQAVLTSSSPSFAAVLVTTGAAAAAGTGVTAVQHANGRVVITFVNVAIPMVDEPGVVAFGSLKVLDLPEGFLAFHGASANLTLTKSQALDLGLIALWDGDFGLGTTAAGNNNALATTEQDLIPTTPTPQAVAGATTAKGVSTATEAFKILDGHTTPKDVYLNFIVDDTDHDVTAQAVNIIVNGTITLVYDNLGDYT